MKKRVFLLLICLVCLCAAVHAEETAAPSLTLDRDRVTLYTEGRVSLRATLLNADARTAQLSWTSSDGTVAAVSDGLVTARSAGKAVIICTAVLPDGTQVSASCLVEVLVPVKEVRLGVNSLILFMGTAGETVPCAVVPADASRKEVNWSSSDPAVATVDVYGHVTPVSPGKASITAVSADDPARKATVNVEVRQPVTSVTFRETYIELAKGKTGKLTAVIAPADASYQQVSWSSSDTSVVSVRDGVLTAKNPGVATLTCAAQDGSGVSGTCTVEVYTPVSGVFVSEKKLDLFIEGPAAALNAEVTPRDAKYRSVLWVSSDESVVTVDETGLVTPVGLGKATVTVYAEEDPSKKATVAVTVLRPVDGIRLSAPRSEVAAGKTLKLSAEVWPEDASVKSVNWSSSDPGIATVSGGTVSGKKPGFVTILCTAADGGGAEERYEIEVYASVSGVKVSGDKMRLFLGTEPTQIQAWVVPADAKYGTLRWTSSDESIATVDQTGLVTPVSPGRAKIIAASTEKPDKKATVTLTVLRPVASVTLDRTEDVIDKGTTVRLTATVLPEDATDKKLVWTSSDKTVATVSNGSVSAKKPGTAVITCRAADGSGVSATYAVSVVQKVTGLKFAKPTLTVTEGVTQSIPVSITPANATDKTLVFTCDDPRVATVDNAAGTVTGLVPGAFTLTAATADGSELTASVKVTVEPRLPLEAVQFDRAGKYGAAYQFEIRFKSLAFARSVRYIGYTLEYNCAGKLCSREYVIDKASVSPGAFAKTGWQDVGYQLTYSTDFKVYLTSVRYDDGTWERFETDNVIGVFP